MVSSEKEAGEEEGANPTNDDRKKLKRLFNKLDYEKVDRKKDEPLTKDNKICYKVGNYMIHTVDERKCECCNFKKGKLPKRVCAETEGSSSQSIENTTPNGSSNTGITNGSNDVAPVITSVDTSSENDSAQIHQLPLTPASEFDLEDIGVSEDEIEMVTSGDENESTQTAAGRTGNEAQTSTQENIPLTNGTNQSSTDQNNAQAKNQQEAPPPKQTQPNAASTSNITSELPKDSRPSDPSFTTRKTEKLRPCDRIIRKYPPPAADASISDSNLISNSVRIVVSKSCSVDHMRLPPATTASISDSERIVENPRPADRNIPIFPPPPESTVSSITDSDLISNSEKIVVSGSEHNSFNFAVPRARPLTSIAQRQPDELSVSTLGEKDFQVDDGEMMSKNDAEIEIVGQTYNRPTPPVITLDSSDDEEEQQKTPAKRRGRSSSGNRTLDTNSKEVKIEMLENLIDSTSTQTQSTTLTSPEIGNSSLYSPISSVESPLQNSASSPYVDEDFLSDSEILKD